MKQKTINFLLIIFFLFFTKTAYGFLPESFSVTKPDCGNVGHCPPLTCSGPDDPCRESGEYRLSLQNPQNFNLTIEQPSQKCKLKITSALGTISYQSIPPSAIQDSSVVLTGANLNLKYNLQLGAFLDKYKIKSGVQTCPISLSTEQYYELKGLNLETFCSISNVEVICPKESDNIDVIPPPLQPKPNLIKKILDNARSQLGVCESPLGSNHINAPYNIDDQWCASFVRWVFNQAGLDMPATNLNHQLYYHLKQNPNWHVFSTGSGERCQSGDIVFFANPSYSYEPPYDPDPRSILVHVGIVESVNADGSLNTIEGNFGDCVSRGHKQIARLGSDGFYRGARVCARYTGPKRSVF